MDDLTATFVKALEWAIYDVDEEEAPAVHTLWLTVHTAPDSTSPLVPRIMVETAKGELASLGRLDGVNAAAAILNAQSDDVIVLAI